MDLIHEPDYCAWLLGPIVEVSGNFGKCSDLKIDSEDFADVSLLHASGARTQIHLDYFGLKPQRRLELFGKELQVEADLIDRYITIIERNEKKKVIFEKLPKDFTYIAELDYFFNCLEMNSQPENGIEDHLKVLTPIIKFRDRADFRG